MNALKTMCAAAILALAVTVPAYAGEVASPGYTPPPPPQDAQCTVEPNACTEEMRTSTETTTDQDPMIAPDVANLLWLLASIF